MSLLLHVMAWATGISVISLPTWLLDPRCLCFLCSPKFLIKPMRPLIINHFHISGNYIAGDFIEIHDNPSASFYQRQHVPFYTTSTATVEDVVPVDTSFFGTDRYTAEVCEKNLREAIDLASGKADACRRIMMADACGYIHIRQFSDARKAELINPFASPKYTFTDDDFCKARCRNPRA